MSETAMLCLVCGKPTLLMCSQCNTAYYCSEQHQLADRGRHLGDCKRVAFSRNLLDLEGVDTSAVFDYRRLYVVRNRARREAAKALLTGRPQDASPHILKSQLASRELLLKEPEVQIFGTDLLLDCLFENDLENALEKLTSLYQKQIPELDLSENRKWSNEHKLFYLVRQDLPFEELIERGDLIILDFDALRPIFLSDPDARQAMNIVSDPEFKTQEKQPEMVKNYYKKLIKIKGVCLASAGTFFDHLAYFEEAEECYMKYLELLENNYGENSQVVSNAYFALGTFYFKRGLKEKPLMCFRRSKEIRLGIVNEFHQAIIDTELNEFIILLHHKCTDEALSLFKKLEKRILKGLGNLNISLAKLYYAGSYLNSMIGNRDEGFTLLENAKHITGKLGESSGHKQGLSEIKELENQLLADFDNQNFASYFNDFKENFMMFEVLNRTTNA